jgi:hypothetical protein
MAAWLRRWRVVASWRRAPTSNEGAIRQGRQLGNDDIFHADNLDALADMKDKVDLIYSLGSLEHDPNMFRVMAACRDRLTEDGVLFVMVPNAMFAASVLGGFRNNWWVNYPQHLHMLSAGCLPELSRTLGFLPVFWDTRLLFEIEAQTHVFDLFNDRNMPSARRDLWSLMLLGAGFGMELNFALSPDTPQNALRFAQLTQAVGGALEHMRQQEMRIRQYLRNAQADTPARSPVHTPASSEP